MMRLPAVPACRADVSRRGAFTIIELLSVITIILILAGLILGIAGHAQVKAARSRAEGEIQAMSTACNNYQIDNGTYPRTSDTDALDTTASWDPASGTAYSAASKALYQMLCGAYYFSGSTLTLWPAGSTTIPKPTTYYPFKDAQLNNTNGYTSGYIDPATVNFIADPFGFSYGYSTHYQADVDAINATPGSTQTPGHGYNPTYDLWSTSGYSQSGGKPYPTTGGMTSASYNTLWVKNW